MSSDASQPAPGPRIAIAAPPALVAAIRARILPNGASSRVTWVPRAEDLAGPIVRGCEALYAHFDGGAESVAALRECVARAGVPVIAIAPGSDPALARAALEAGAADALTLAAAAADRLAFQAALAAAHRDLLGRARREAAALRAAALTDPVTGLQNKRAFEQRLDEEESKAYRTGRAVSLVLADIDHFKEVNDAFGHQAGDTVLRELAALLLRSLRKYDIACRIGGDEFGLIFPQTELEHALQIADRLRAELRAHAFPGLPPDWRAAASFGAAELPSAAAATKDDVVRAADRALYQAKSAGRDRACAAAGAGGPAAEPPAGPRPDHARIERLRASVRDLGDETTAAFMQSIAALVELIEEDSGHAFGCGAKIAEVARRIARELDLPADEVERIGRAALFQELGMVGVIGAVGHDGGLAPEERELLKQHPTFSVRIAAEVRLLRDELPLILHHHERFDGTGYPSGLRGERIPLGARVLAVATAYEAMTSARPYRAAPLSRERAVEEIGRLAGTWYDPRVARAFAAAFGAP